MGDIITVEASSSGSNTPSSTTTTETTTNTTSQETPQPQKIDRRWRIRIARPWFWVNRTSISDERYKTLTSYETVQSYPRGYPQLAAFQNSDPNFRIYRRYGTLRNRVILYRQAELDILEKELLDLDQADFNAKNGRTASYKKDSADPDSQRVKLIDKLEKKLKQYDELLEREQRSGMMPKPSKRDFFSLVNYIWNSKPIVKSEAQILNHRDDFVQLSARTESPLENFLDYLICTWVPIRWLRHQFSSDAQASKICDRRETLTSARKLFIISRLIATGLAIAVIVVPLAVLTSDIFSDHSKLIALMISVIAFPAAIQLAARPNTMELFVATATYCAVLTTLLATTSTFSLSQLQSDLYMSKASRTV